MPIVGIGVGVGMQPASQVAGDGPPAPSLDYLDTYDNGSALFLEPGGHAANQGPDTEYDAIFGVGQRLQVSASNGYITVEDNTFNGQQGALIEVLPRTITQGMHVNTIIGDTTPPTGTQRQTIIHAMVDATTQNGFQLEAIMQADFPTITQFNGVEIIGGVNTTLFSFVEPKGADYTVDMNITATKLQLRVNGRVEEAVHSVPGATTLEKIATVVALSSVAGGPFPDPRLLETSRGIEL